MRLTVYFSTILLALGIAGAGAAQEVSTEEAVADKVLGSPDAPVEMIAYESLTCPHCASFHAEAWQTIKSTYVDTGKLRFVYRDFPFDPVGLRAGMMARCLGNERYFGMIEILYKTQAQWATADDPLAALAGIGRLAGLSAEGFEACMANQALMDGILERRQAGERDFEVSSTPTFFINGHKIVGARPFEVYEEVIAPLVE